MVNELVLPAFTETVFDSAEIYRELVAGRATIYLDHNAWIELSDAKSNAACACRDVCVDAVEDGRVVFPLSTASVSEVLEHPKSDRREAQAALMDRLSLGVCFKALPFVHRIEVDAFYDFRFRGIDSLPDASTMFTSMPDWLGEGRMQFPEGWTPSMHRHFKEFLMHGAQYRSLHWAATHMDVNELRERHLRQQARFVDEMTASMRRAREHFGKLHFPTFLLEERSALFKKDVVPRIGRRLRAEHRLDGEVAWRRNQKLGPLPLDDIFGRLPALEMMARLFAARAMNPTRQVRPQDFWDNEHALVAPSYADAFVSFDGGLRHLLSQCGSVVRAKVIGTLEELVAWVEQTESKS